jgi:hypothetical protein
MVRGDAPALRRPARPLLDRDSPIDCQLRPPTLDSDPRSVAADMEEGEHIDDFEL